MLPAEGRELFAIWTELDWMRPQGMNGPGAITFEAIDSWSRLYSRRLSRWAVRLLCLMDIVYRATAYEAMNPPKKK